MPIIDDGVAITGGAQVTADHAMVVVQPGLNADGSTRAGGDAALGGVVLMSRRDNGVYTGQVVNAPIRVSATGHLRVGLSTMLFSDLFNALAQNTNQWAYTFSTLTASQPGAGTLNFGTVQGTANTHGAFMRTWQYFPLVGEAPLHLLVTSGSFTSALVANEQVLIGFGLPGAAGTAPTDGVNFLITSAGIIGELRYSATVTQTGVLLPPAGIALGRLDDYEIIVSDSAVQFLFNGDLLGSIPLPDANAQAFMQASLPVFIQKLCTGPVSNTNTWRVGSVAVILDDVNSVKPWSHQLAGAGQALYAGQNGQVMASTSANNMQAALVAAGAGSNTALPVGHVAGLGGIATITAQASNVAAAGDMIVTVYLNTVPTVNISGRNLYITGVTIDAVNSGAAVATTPTTLLMQLAFGHTTISLAVAESASFATATTHAARKIALGFLSFPVGAVAGTPAAGRIIERFDTPIVVRPGELIASTARFIVGTATASQAIVFTVKFDGYFE